MTMEIPVVTKQIAPAGEPKSPRRRPFDREIQQFNSRGRSHDWLRRASLGKAVRPQQGSHAGVLRFSRHFCRDRRYFAAVEAEIAQHAVIEVAKRVASGSRFLPLPVACVRLPCACAGRAKHRDDDVAQHERAVGASGAMQLVARGPQRSCSIPGRSIGRCICDGRVPHPRLGAVLKGCGLFAERVVTCGPELQDDGWGFAARTCVARRVLLNLSQIFRIN